jgi:hypothetical protein
MKEVVFERAFDPRRCRHLLEGRTSVLHCHHYSTLYTQLADDCIMLDARGLLARVSAETFFEILSGLQRKHGWHSPAERLAAAERYYAFAGLGKLKIVSAGPDAGEAELERSHIDEGWVRKWGRRNEPVNFITQGFLAAAFAAAFDRTPSDYAVREIVSMVSGADRSRFLVARG